MAVHQYFSGYVLDGVSQMLRTSDKHDAWKGLLESLTVFDVEYNFNPPQNDITDSMLAVANNLLSRGLPTRASLFLEETFRERLQLTDRADENGNINYNLQSIESREMLTLLYRSFCIVDPRVKYPAAMNHLFGSDFEKDFLFSKLSSIACGDFICQLAEPQRLLKTIAEAPQNFEAQTVDFCIDLPLYFSPEIFPTVEPKRKGIVIEVDGFHHNQFKQRILDIIRDRAANYDTVRITPDDNQNLAQSKKLLLQNFLDRYYIRFIKENYSNPLYNTEIGMKILQLALSPIAIARLQKIILQLIIQEKLELDAELWRIAVLERDVPCAHLAIEDLKLIFENLFLLENKNRHLPEIELQVFNTPEFATADLNNGKIIQQSEQLREAPPIDVLIDLSVFQRAYCSALRSDLSEKLRPSITVLVRSSFSKKSERSFDCANTVVYDALIKKTDKEDEEDKPRINALKFFMQNIFRKTGFREGQKEIISRALTCQSVIALLPTGGGKSLTYQLSALLQPGICLVVDPIKSLMQDQNDNLNDVGIDATTFINSSLSTQQRRDATDGLIKGKFLFAFISPERLQIQEFREDYLGKMQSMYRKHFSYCVIDEAHCLSEWGHDFRTSYLRLGKNATRYCSSGLEQRNVPIIALTGTASYDVLADVQREVKIDDEIAIITPKEYKRDELNFKLVNAECAGQSNVGLCKRQKLLESMNSIPSLNFSLPIDQFNFFRPNGYHTNSGIIFCPHRTYTYGVEDVLGYVTQKVQALKNVSGYYYGAKNASQDKELTDIQRRYKKNQLSLLVATNAFGMGIDKPNIRYTIHFNIPASIESYYQEAGRAGRDKKISYCYIIYNKNVDKEINLTFFKNSFKGKDRELNYAFELLDEITFPYSDNVRQLQELATDDLGIVIKTNRWQQDAMDRLYINSDEVYTVGNQQRNKTFGFINVTNLAFNPENNIQKMAASADRCSEVLNQILAIINANRPTNVPLNQWLDSIRESPAKPQGYLNTYKSFQFPLKR